MREYIGLKCSHCGEELYYNDMGVLRCENCGPVMWQFISNDASGYAVDKIDVDELMPKTIQICGCERIILKDKSLDFVFELSRGQIEDFDEIIINGIKFKKEI